jgi:hypothetical protein
MVEVRKVGLAALIKVHAALHIKLVSIAAEAAAESV